MDKQTLEKYMSLNKAIKQLQKNIDKYEKKNDAVYGKVVGSSNSFPYVAKSFQVSGGTELGNSKQRELQKRILIIKLHEKQKELEKIELECENFFADLADDPTVYNIFTMHYSDGMTMDRIGIELNMDKSTVSRTIKNILEKVE